MLACALCEEGGVRIGLEKGVAKPFSEEQEFWGRGEEGEERCGVRLGLVKKEICLFRERRNNSDLFIAKFKIRNLKNRCHKSSTYGNDFLIKNRWPK